MGLYYIHIVLSLKFSYETTVVQSVRFYSGVRFYNFNLRTLCIRNREVTVRGSILSYEVPHVEKNFVAIVQCGLASHAIRTGTYSSTPQHNEMGGASKEKQAYTRHALLK